MPLKPLPRRLVDRIARMIQKKDLQGRTNNSFRKLRNLDARINAPGYTTNTPAAYGGRVRGLSVKRNYPKIGEVVLKWEHGGRYDADMAKQVANHVDNFNALPIEMRRNCIMQKPIAYKISHEIYVMSKADYPIVEGIERVLNGHTYVFKEVTLEQRKLIEQAAKKIEAEGKRNEFLEACSDLERANFGLQNVFFLGMHWGKFKFIPMIDLY